MDVDWDRRAPMSIGARLATYGQIFGALAAIVVAVGLAARASGTVASLLLG